jgi:hypothetical protein
VYLAIISIAPDPPAGIPHLDVHVLIDLLWTVADPGDAVEHIAARTVPGSIDVGLYLRVPSADAAERTAHALLERATRTVPVLRGWHIRPAAEANGTPTGEQEI